jgi:hypothetical protein
MSAVRIHAGTKISMRDGIRLSATIYTPAEQHAPVPAIASMTPYVRDSLHEHGMYFAQHGFVFAAVDVRGRGDSEGALRPFIQESKDGGDLVSWIARQPYCNGRVAMRGSSYGGYAQWVTAAEFPSGLSTIVPTAAPYPGLDFPMRSNIFHPYIVQWLMLVAGRASQKQLFSDSDFWSSLYRRWVESGRSFRELGSMVGASLPTFEEWLTHPEPDAYWDAHNPTVEQYARLDIPILTITGCYDDDQPGALEHYKRHMQHASPAARARHFLVIGPWDHARTAQPCADFGGMKVGPASAINLNKLHVEWYAWTMQGGPRPEFLRRPVAYYVAGADEWRYADSLDEVTAGHTEYFLDSTGAANDVFCSGSLQVGPGIGPPDEYTYDPRAVTGREVDAEARADGGSLIEQGLVHALHGRMLVYHSAPLVRDTEISGFFRLHAWIAMDCADTDLYVSIYDIDFDGNSVLLTTDALRARYREGLRTPKPICTDQPIRYAFERFTFVSRVVKRGHRLRLVVAPLGRLIYAPFTQKNYNAGGIVAEETCADGKPVTVKLYHDGTYPSALCVPLGRVEFT